jgi:hypothetical protein
MYQCVALQFLSRTVGGVALDAALVRVTGGSSRFEQASR